MKCSKLLNKLTERIGFTPKQADLCKILEYGYSTISARAQRDSEFSDEEIEKIEEFYAIDLRGGCNDCIELEHIHINPSCGRGTAVYEDADITPIKLGTKMIQSVLKISDPRNLKIFKASGDSMTPLIEDNDLLLVDVEKKDFNNGGIFLLTINNDWYVKRLRLRVTGELDIISDNTKYPLETLKPNSDIEIVVKGKVIKNLSRGL